MVVVYISPPHVLVREQVHKFRNNLAAKSPEAKSESFQLSQTCQKADQENQSEHPTFPESRSNQNNQDLR